MANMSGNDRDFGVHVYWDINTTEFPRELASSIIERIYRALRQFDERYFIKKVIGYGDFNFYGGVQIFSYGNVAVDLKNRPTRKSYCRTCPRDAGDKEDLPDHCLKQDLFWNTYKDKPPYTILLITSDADFEPMMTKLGKMGFIILLACEENASNVLKSAAKIKWTWGTMIHGNGPLPH